ncbi:protein of unknown function [Zobellia uliginosa]|uniref:DUF4440 domain-containing protein n=1 Tax=Zobellia uliginosa TaxID=143224 RepID=A0ABY1KUK0_9FLAO|nr:nuclear transport factor 2 family protein [Zobellia uliginosa]SIS66954.1 protein of unknown function [Zobellia uliginosa]
MKKFTLFLTFALTLAFNGIYTQNNDIDIIKDIMKQQEEAWSAHDLEGFMQGYWKSEDLTYFSGGKITKGWQTTLDNYKKGYPTKAHTGELRFRIAQVTEINEEAYYVMGEYFLTREAGDAHGTFMIIFKKINGEWKIVADSSC